MSESESVEDRIAALEERVADLEAQLEENPSTTSSGGFGDHRDQAVLDYLDVGTVYTVRDLASAYRSRTDLTNSDTIKQRLKILVTDGPFESERLRAWRYVGVDRDG